MRGVTPDHLQGLELARMDVARLRDLRKGERKPDPSLAAARRQALEEAIDWRLELQGLALAVFDSRPHLLEAFRPGLKASRSVPLIASELGALLQAAQEHRSLLAAVGVTDEFRARGRDIHTRLLESIRRMEEERSLTPQSTLDLNLAKGVLYTRTRFLCRLARVEFRHETERAGLYGYSLLRRRARAAARN
jgi:hypothetical protein